jgi:sporulation protein YlmC with PRC-barrel domain
MELSDDPKAFSALIGLRVEDQSGRVIGRVYEVRGRWQGDGSIVFEQLLVGRRALLRRLRGPGPDWSGIPWEAVIELADDRIVIS